MISSWNTEMFSDDGNSTSRKRVCLLFLRNIARRSICVVPRHADLELPDEKYRPFLEAMFADDDIILVTDHERIMTARDLIDRMTEC